jgi:hypothetical protein
MTSDPTLADIQAALDASTPPSLRWEGWAEDCLIAAHWFALDYYQGEHSNLYAVLCGIEYEPNGLKFENESEGVRELYESLAKFWQWPSE